MCLDNKFISNYEGKHHKIRLASNYHKGFKIEKNKNLFIKLICTETKIPNRSCHLQ